MKTIQEMKADASAKTVTLTFHVDELVSMGNTLAEAARAYRAQGYTALADRAWKERDRVLTPEVMAHVQAVIDAIDAREGIE